MTDLTINERLARIEASQDHITAQLDKLAENRDRSSERLVRVEAQVSHVLEQMPLVHKNTTHVAHDDGWREAKEDAESDRRAVIAIGISLIAIVVATYEAIWGG